MDVRAFVQRDPLPLQVRDRFVGACADDQNGLGRRPTPLGQDVQERSPRRLRKIGGTSPVKPTSMLPTFNPSSSCGPAGNSCHATLTRATEPRFENFADADQIRTARSIFDSRSAVRRREPRTNAGSPTQPRPVSRTLPAPKRTLQVERRKAAPRDAARTDETAFAWFPRGMCEAFFTAFAAIDQASA